MRRPKRVVERTGDSVTRLSAVHQHSCLSGGVISSETQKNWTSQISERDTMTLLCVFEYTLLLVCLGCSFFFFNE